MAQLGLAFGRTVDGALIGLYYGILGQKLSDDQWRQAVRRALEQESYFPPPAVLLGPYREAQEAEDQAEAGRLFQQIAQGAGVSTWTAAGGRYWRRDWIAERLGEAAAVAFEAAGGDDIFRSMADRDVPFIERRFTAAYRAVARGEALTLPAARLTPRLAAVSPAEEEESDSEDQGQEQEQRPLDRHEAGRVLEQIRRRA